MADLIVGATALPHRRPMRYDLAIFDFDGTLADSGPWFFGMLNEVADRFGFRRTSADEREALRQLSSREILRALDVPMWRLPAIARHMRRRASEDVAAIRVFEGVSEVLVDLKRQGMKLAIVSSNAESTVRTVLGQEIAGSIDMYACGSSMFGKAAKMGSVIRRLSVTPERSICIGDETRDIDAARSIGAASAAALWGYAAPHALVARRPTMLLEHVEDLRKLAA